MLKRFAKMRGKNSFWTLLLRMTIWSARFQLSLKNCYKSHFVLICPDDNVLYRSRAHTGIVAAQMPKCTNHTKIMTFGPYSTHTHTHVLDGRAHTQRRWPFEFRYNALITSGPKWASEQWCAHEKNCEKLFKVSVAAP